MNRDLVVVLANDKRAVVNERLIPIGQVDDAAGSSWRWNGCSSLPGKSLLLWKLAFTGGEKLSPGVKRNNGAKKWL